MYCFMESFGALQIDNGIKLDVFSLCKDHVMLVVDVHGCWTLDIGLRITYSSSGVSLDGKVW